MTRIGDRKNEFDDERNGRVHGQENASQRMMGATAAVPIASMTIIKRFGFAANRSGKKNL